MHVRIDCFQSGHTKADYDSLKTLLTQTCTIECEVNDKTQSAINDSVLCRITGGSETDRSRLEPLIKTSIQEWLGNRHADIIFHCSGASETAPPKSAVSS